MKWFKKEALAETKQPADVAAVAVVEQPKSVPIPKSYEAHPDLNGDELEEYLKVATALGLSSQGAVASERLRHVIKRGNFHIFDRVQVAEYLNEKLGKDQWEWAGLRPCDVEEFSDSNWFSHHGDHRIPFSHRQYSANVPLPVLLTVQRIAEEVPEARFYISNRRENPWADPFLMVTTKNSSSFIIERWDEPSFRER